MKKITCLGLLASILFLAKTTTAQTAIAVTNDSGSTFYTTLDSAITKAVSGDYIYLPGGSFTISVPINKQLQIIGVGHNPDSCAVTGITQVTGSIFILNGSDHGSISGVKITGTVSFGEYANDVSINYYAIERCNISGPVYAINLAARSLNIIINECIIQGIINGNNTQGFQLTKCIIFSNESYTISSFNSNAYFINNIFSSPNFVRLFGIQNCYFKNNLFLTSVYDYTYPYCQNNLFQNNLFNDNCSLNMPTYNSFRNNITGPVTSLFKNQSGTVFDYKQDYHILSTSPTHNAGTDGTDLGIYGTGSPWKEGSLPSNPHIQSKTISTVNGNLNVKIKVAAQDY